MWARRIAGIPGYFPLRPRNGDNGGVDAGGEEEEQGACETPIDYDFPFDYYIEGDDLFINTEGDPIRTLIGPWGAHTPPHTGHFEGNGKSDWAAVFADSWGDSTMTRLDGGGACSKGDLCGVHMDELAGRLPVYVAPSDGFLVTEVKLEEVTDSHDFDRFKWEVVGRGCPYQYGLGHLGSIADDLRQALMDRGVADPDTVSEPGELFRDYENPIVLNKGDAIAIRVPGKLRGLGGGVLQ